MNEIVCAFNLFDMKHSVFRINGTNKEKIGAVPLSELSDFIATSCMNYNINHIHLYGDSGYATKICMDINEYEKNRYGNNKIEIEVN